MSADRRFVLNCVVNNANKYFELDIFWFFLQSIRTLLHRRRSYRTTIWFSLRTGPANAIGPGRLNENLPQPSDRSRADETSTYLRGSYAGKEINCQPSNRC